MRWISKTKDTVFQYTTTEQNKDKTQQDQKQEPPLPQSSLYAENATFLSYLMKTSAHANARFQLLPEAKRQPHDPSLPIL
jgi:hypothetical protein